MRDETTILKLSPFGLAGDSSSSSSTESISGLVLAAVRDTDAPLIKPQNSNASPQSMLGLVTYCYAKGVYGSGDIERKLRKGQPRQEVPDARSIRRFRFLNRAALLTVLEKTLRLMRRSRPGVEAAEKLETASLIDITLHE